MKGGRSYGIGFTALILFETWTQVSFKLASYHTGEFALTTLWLESAVTDPWIYCAVGGYCGAFFAWMMLLEHAPVGPAFAASHLDVVTVLIISVPLFGEHLSTPRIVGAACIVLGIILLSHTESKQSPT
jgi:drug/metabolite transporter (DMT)-like permease